MKITVKPDIASRQLLFTDMQLNKPYIIIDRMYENAVVIRVSMDIVIGFRPGSRCFAWTDIKYNQLVVREAPDSTVIEIKFQ